MSEDEGKKKPKKSKKPSSQLPQGPGIWTQLAIAFAIFLVLSGAYTAVRQYWLDSTEEVSLSQIAADIGAGNVTELIIAGDTIKANYSDGSKKESRKESEASFTETLSNYGLTPEQFAGVKVTVEDQGGVRYWALTLAPLMIPVLLLVGIMWYLSRQVRGAGMQAFTFGRSMARLVSPDDEVQRVTFADVAGAREAKAELTEIVDFLKNPKKFIAIGARIPKGVLLMGASGTGKTLLARAVAGESGVPFYSISGSEFVEMFVGVGASRVRDTFSVAKKSAPAILFIDEIDAIGRVRGSGVGGGNDEREQTLNQILVEMDGFEPNEKVVVLAASVTGDVPVLVKKDGTYALKPIGDVIDAYYADGEENIEKDANGLEVLGFERKDTARTFKNPFFGSSAFKKVRSVFRHRVKEVYEIKYPGGIIRTTGNHSVFVRSRIGILPKRVDELSAGEELVNIPYIANRTSEREVRSHVFAQQWNAPTLSVYAGYENGTTDLKHAYEFALNSAGTISQSRAGAMVGVSQRTIGLWRLTDRMPRALSRAYFKHSLPENVPVTRELMRLFGYYVAEGYARKELDFCFNAKEKEYHEDVISLMRTIFGVEPDEIRATGNAVNIVYHSKPLASFFISHVGKGARGKHLPTFLFEAPREYFVEFLRGYSRGDGHVDKHQRLTLTSVSKQLLLELQWLSRMHGYHTHYWSYTIPAGRRIAGGQPLPETTAWRLGYGKTQNPLQANAGKASILRAKIQSIKKVPYDGFVYDFCGCENEAFFGGVAPILLHNTNRPDVLDPALVRPGRFDRRVTIDLPDRRDREEILKTHSRQKPLGPDVNLAVIAERTPGFSGADLANLMNEAAILAAREDRTEVTQYDLIRSIEKVMLGPERRSHVLNKKEKEITAYHEAGHALIASVLPYADPVHKVSIISRGRAAGYTLKLPLEDRRMQSRLEFLDDIAVSLGGYIAEKMVYGDITTGASNDLQVLTALARDMVTRYGMSEKFGPMALDPAMGRTLFGAGVEANQQSQEIASAIDAEVKAIIGGAHKKALDVMTKHRKVLDAIAMALVEVENLERDAFEKILIEHGIIPKKKQDIEHQPLA